MDQDFGKQCYLAMVTIEGRSDLCVVPFCDAAKQLGENRNRLVEFRVGPNHMTDNNCTLPDIVISSGSMCCIHG